MNSDLILNTRKIFEGFKNKNYNAVNTSLLSNYYPLSIDGKNMNVLHHIVSNVNKIKGPEIHIAKILKHPNAKQIINQQDVFGNTPLHLSVVFGYHGVTDALIKAGANQNIKNKDGMRVKLKPNNTNNMTDTLNASEELMNVRNNISKTDSDTVYGSTIVDSIINMFTGKSNKIHPTKNNSIKNATVSDDSINTISTNNFLNMIKSYVDMGTSNTMKQSGGGDVIASGTRNLHMRLHEMENTVSEIEFSGGERDPVVENEITALFNSAVENITKQLSKVESKLSALNDVTNEKNKVILIRKALYEYIKEKNPEFAKLDIAKELEKKSKDLTKLKSMLNDLDEKIKVIKTYKRKTRFRKKKPQVSEDSSSTD